MRARLLLTVPRALICTHVAAGYIEDYLTLYGPRHPNILLVVGHSKDLRCACTITIACAPQADVDFVGSSCSVPVAVYEARVDHRGILAADKPIVGYWWDPVLPLVSYDCFVTH